MSLASDSMSPSVMDFWCDAQCAIDAAGKCPTNVCRVRVRVRDRVSSNPNPNPNPNLTPNP